MDNWIIRFIDEFHFIFKWAMPLKTYRYAVCGGSNFVFDTVLYFIFYNFIFAKENMDAGLFVLSPHIASLFAVYPITLLSGFLLNKYITFTSSNLKGTVQLKRYILVSIGSLFIVYLFMKVFVDVVGIYPTPAKILTTILAVIYSYILQNKFSFKTSI
tara:strand:+ start:13804 stop:14277 length:474 start_codon:yes stop_codon:yes gene_type:complete